MRPSGFCWRWARTNFSPTIRAPWMAPGSFAINRLPPLPAPPQGLAGLLGSLRLGRGRIHRRGPLQVADLLLQRVKLALLVRLRRGGGQLGRREPVGRRRRLRRSGGLILIIVVQVAYLGLQDPHGLTEGACRNGQLLGPEQHDEYHSDDQDLPRAVEQVTNHLRSSLTPETSSRPESTRQPPERR